MLRLYHRMDCPFCWKIRIGFAYTDIAPTLIVVPKGTRNDFVINAHAVGTIPVLEIDNAILTQSTVILEYINDRYAQGRLLPDSAERKAVVRSLCYYSDTVIGGALRNVVFQRRDFPAGEQNEALIEQSIAAWKICLDYLELNFQGPYFFGQFSMADCALWPRFALAERYGATVGKSHPHLLAYWQRAKLNPWFKSASEI